MKTFTNPQVAISDADLNLAYKHRSFWHIKVKVLKAMKSIAIAVVCMTGGVISGAISGTEAHANTAPKTLSYGDSGSGVATLQASLGGIAVDGVFGPQTLSKLKSYQAAHGLEVNAAATPETLASLGVQNLDQTPLQYGKLKLVNNTLDEVVVFIYQPGEEHYSRYAYLPPCSERMLQSTYSNLSEVSLGLDKRVSIGSLEGDFFEFNASSLSADKYSLCPGQFQVREEPTATLVSLGAVDDLLKKGGDLLRKGGGKLDEIPSGATTAIEEITKKFNIDVTLTKKMVRALKDDDFPEFWQSLTTAQRKRFNQLTPIDLDQLKGGTLQENEVIQFLELSLNQKESEFLESILISKARVTGQNDIEETVALIKLKARQGKIDELREYFGGGKIIECFNFTKAEVENIVAALKGKNEIASLLVLAPMPTSGTGSATLVSNNRPPTSLSPGDIPGNIRILCPTRFGAPTAPDSINL